jgi:xanthine dehydrogenase YagS FAD-binding subunit
MKNFVLHRPKTTEEAVGLLDAKWGKTELLAGGTDLLDLQKEYVAQPDKVVSLTCITGLDKVEVFEREPPILSIGAGVKLATLASDPTIKQYCPALAETARIIGGPQIRNMGTLGGNLCQRNRCWYFRDEHVKCLLKGGDKCFALDGENRYHAIFVKGHPCVIVNPSTLAPVLIAMGAVAKVLGSGGKTRTIELSKFFKAPSAAGEREHVLAANEIVTAVTIDTKKQQKSASYEVRHKQSHDWPLVQAAVAFVLEQGKPKGVKIVLGHVAPTPHLAEKAAKLIEGEEITEVSAAAAGEAAADGAKPLGQNGYKTKLVAVAVKRALLTAAGAKKYWEA